MPVILICLLACLFVFTTFVLLMSCIGLSYVGVFMFGIINMANPNLPLEKINEISNIGVKGIVKMVILPMTTTIIWVIAFSVLLGLYSKRKKTISNKASEAIAPQGVAQSQR